MTLPLPQRFVRVDQRLALGLEPLDAMLTVRGTVTVPPSTPGAPVNDDRPLRLAHAIDVLVEGTPLGITRRVRPWRRGGRELEDSMPALERREIGRYVLRYAPDLDDEDAVVVRLVDRARRYVPRRLRIPLVVPMPSASPAVTLADVDASLPARRMRRPFLWPGAAYPLPSGATGLRGVVRQGGVLVPWTRVTATLPIAGGGAPVVVGRARGDDRGEFLLLITPRAASGGAIPLTLALDLTIEMPPPAPAVPLNLPDPLVRLPIESVPPSIGWPRADVTCAWDFEFPVTPWPPAATPALRTFAGIAFVPGRVLSSEVPPFVFA